MSTRECRIRKNRKPWGRATHPKTGPRKELDEISSATSLRVITPARAAQRCSVEHGWSACFSTSASGTLLSAFYFDLTLQYATPTPAK